MKKKSGSGNGWNIPRKTDENFLKERKIFDSNVDFLAMKKTIRKKDATQVMEA